MSIDLLCYLAALVFILLDAFNVPSSVKWFSLAGAALILSLIF